MADGPSAPLQLPATLVVVDTDAFSHVYVRRASAQAQRLRDRLVGRLVVIATQTSAELQVWPELQGWGLPRRAELATVLASTAVLPVGQDVVEAYVRLQVDCHRVGHALSQKQHTADRWVAATAVALDRPLLSLDLLYVGTPGLRLL